MSAAAAAAAAKSLQSCPTLCDPIDGSPTSIILKAALLSTKRELSARKSSLVEKEEWSGWSISKAFWDTKIEKQILNLYEATRDLKQPKQSQEIMTLKASHFLFQTVLQSYSNFKQMILS